MWLGGAGAGAAAKADWKCGQLMGLVCRVGVTLWVAVAWCGAWPVNENGLVGVVCCVGMALLWVWPVGGSELGGHEVLWVWPIIGSGLCGHGLVVGVAGPGSAGITELPACLSCLCS